MLQVLLSCAYTALSAGDTLETVTNQTQQKLQQDEPAKGFTSKLNSSQYVELRKHYVYTMQLLWETGTRSTWVHSCLSQAGNVLRTKVCTWTCLTDNLIGSNIRGMHACACGLSN